MINDNYNILLEASEAGDIQKVRDIMRSIIPPVDLNCRNKNGDTPLILAARNGHDNLVRFFLDEAVDVDAINQSGDDALIAAAECPDNLVILDMLLCAGASINRKNTLGRTALIEASSIGDIRNVNYLLKHDPDIDVVTDEEETALTFAVVNESLNVVIALIEAGANVNWKDTKGWTALTYAGHSGNKEIIQLLANDRTK